MFPTWIRQALLVMVWLSLGLAAAQAAPPTRDLTAQPQDCVACHKGEGRYGGAMPAKHKPVQGRKLAECLECHEKKTPDSLITKLPGSHLHQLAGVSCADCHDKTTKPALVESARCLSCHGSGDKLAALTAKVKPQNPHRSVHYGTELDCNLCHHQHEKSENYCAECHRYDYKVP